MATNASKQLKKTTDAVEILHGMAGDDSRARELLNKARVNVRVAKLIYDARTKAGLTQAQLADRVGTRQPVIARLEDADYDGHSLTMLQRVAAALNRQIDVRFSSAGVKVFRGKRIALRSRLHSRR